MREGRPGKILVIRLSSLGDVARLLPSLRSLEGQAERVDLTVEDRFLPLLHLFPPKGRVVAYPRKAAGSPFRNPVRWARAMAAYLRELRGEGYDLALDLHGIFRSAVVARLSGAEAAGYARGFGKEHSHLLYDRTLTPGPSVRISRFERYAGALRALGFEAPGEEEPLRPEVPEAARREVEAFLRERGLEPGRYLLAFLGTSRAQARKRWPPFRFAELASRAHGRWGIPTVVGWGPEEADLLSSFPRAPFLHVPPLWPLDRLVEAIRLAGAFVGADTGAMHLSALLGTRTVALLGPTDPVVNRPYGNRYRIVHDPEARAACEGETCRHRRCMGRISADRVVLALEELLEGGEGGRLVPASGGGR